MENAERCCEVGVESVMDTLKEIRESLMNMKSKIIRKKLIIIWNNKKRGIVW